MDVNGYKKIQCAPLSPIKQTCSPVHPSPYISHKQKSRLCVSGACWEHVIVIRPNTCENRLSLLQLDIDPPGIPKTVAAHLAGLGQVSRTTLNAGSLGIKHTGMKVSMCFQRTVACSVAFKNAAPCCHSPPAWFGGNKWCFFFPSGCLRCRTPVRMNCGDGSTFARYSRVRNAMAELVAGMGSRKIKNKTSGPGPVRQTGRTRLLLVSFALLLLAGNFFLCSSILLRLCSSTLLDAHGVETVCP